MEHGQLNIRALETLERIGHRLFILGMAAEALEDDQQRHAFGGLIGDLQSGVRSVERLLREPIDTEEVDA